MQLDQVRTKLDPAALRADPSRALKRIFIRTRRKPAKRKSLLGKLVRCGPNNANAKAMRIDPITDVHVIKSGGR
jgi:hypothetical protein